MSRYTEEFERFWKVYPCRWNKDLGVRVKRKKYPAFEKWQKLSQEIRDECLTKAKYIQQTEGAYVRDAITWLNQYGWEDIETSKQDPFAEAAALEKRRQKTRNEEGSYWQGRPTEELKQILTDLKTIAPKWLIKEILAERAKQ